MSEKCELSDKLIRITLTNKICYIRWQRGNRHRCGWGERKHRDKRRLRYKRVHRWKGRTKEINKRNKEGRSVRGTRQELKTPN